MIYVICILLKNSQPPRSPCAYPWPMNPPLAWACPSDWPSQLSALQGSSGPVAQTEPWSHSHPGDSGTGWEPVGWRRNNAWLVN